MTTRNKIFHYEKIFNFSGFLYILIQPELIEILLAIFIVLLVGITIYQTLLFRSQKKLILKQNEILNSRIVKIERDNTHLNSEFTKLLQKNNLNEKLITMMSHDLRSPLCCLQNMTSIFNYYIRKNDLIGLVKTSSEIDLTVRNLNNMLDNLLNWYMNDTNNLTNNPSYINVAELFNKCLEDNETFAKTRQINFIPRIDKDLHVYADFNLVHDVLRNIINNSVRYSPVCSSVEIDVTRIEKVAFIKITDYGHGIPDQVINSIEQGNVYKPLTKSGKEKGIGLGLYISKKFINKSNGTLTLRNRVPCGTEVSITLPTCNELN